MTIGRRIHSRQPRATGYMPTDGDTSENWYFQRLRKLSEKYPLLAPEEEIVLGKRVQAYLQIKAQIDVLQAEAGRQLSLTEIAQQLEIDLSVLQQTLTSGFAARQRMINCNLRLCIRIATEFYKTNPLTPLSDLAQDANLGLINAVEKFDPDKGFRFSTYAYWWVQQACQKCVKRHKNLIVVPSHLYEKTYRLKKCRYHFFSEHGRYPTTEELAQAAEITPDEVRRLFRLARPLVSLNLRVNEDGTELGDFLGSELADPLVPDHLRGANVDLYSVLRSHLDAQQMEYICLRYGLFGQKPLTQQQAAQAMGLTIHMGRKLRASTFARLRSAAVREELYGIFEIFQEVA